MKSAKGSYQNFLDGDDSEIIPIIRDYKDGLIAYLNSFTGSYAESEELAEEVFVKLVIKKPRFKGDSSFKTWLYSVARNTALDHLRKSSAHVTSPLEDALQQAAEEDIEREYLRTEQRIALNNAMRKLNSEYYRVLCLVYFEDFSNSDVARIMKKSKRQVENLTYRAKCSLKKELEKEGFVYEEL